ncbi:MAG: GH92 family glycosyl hydrolase [Bacteroidales bacterium]|nr:GH92 family glycosyl hydrolase [Bacteroidales bacterium]
MNTAVFSGILLILISGCCSGVFSTPFNRNRKWSWENNWLIWSIFALIVCPLIAVSVTIPHVFSVYAQNPSTTGIIALFGIVWGISALLFGKGIDYLGVSLAIPIMQGLINAIGTIAPFLFKSPSDLFTPQYANILIGVAVTVAGIILFSNAGKSKSAEVKTGKNFKVGLLICILAGVFGPLINFGFVFGEPLQKTAVELGAESLFSANATWAVIFFAGFLVNAARCIYLLRKNGTADIYRESKPANFLWAALAGILWYGSILLYGMGCNHMGTYAASVGWAIMQATAIIAGNVAGILLGEWKGASRGSIVKMASGMLLLVVSVVIFSSNAGEERKEPVDYVDTRIGTSAWTGKSTLSGPEEPMGFVYPGVGLPNAMIQFSPQTARTDRCYFSSQPQIQGFRASHYPNGAAMSEYGSFTVMPTVGEDAIRVNDRASAYSHDNETARPYYYSVTLDDYDIRAELAAMSKAGIMKFTFPASEHSNIVIDNARSEYENYFRVIPGRNEIEGYITNAGRVGNQGYTGREFACYFVAKFSKPFDSYAVVPEPVFSDITLNVAGGFRGQFFNNPDFSGAPVLERTDRDVDFSWEASPAGGVNPDFFSVRYSGRFTARKSGKHVFYLISDDYSRLYVNGEKVIDTRKTHRPFADMYSIVLEEGESCDVTVEYAEKTGAATLRFACLEPEPRTEAQLAALAEKGSTASAARVSFATKAGEQVEVRIGTSFIDFNQARKNLASEVGSKSFGRLTEECREAWEKEIGRIQVKTTEENRRIFYTAMQRIALTPRNLTEDGYHYSAFNGRIVPGIMYTDYSIWDTFRALHPLLLIIKPEKASEMITALLNSYDEGGWIPKWPSPGYSNIMHGTHGDAVIADAYVKGVRDFDTGKALEAMMKNATTPGTGIYKARVGISDYIRLGYVPTDKYGESVERTMEFAYDDFCIAQVAKDMGRDDLYTDLMRRSKNYLNVLDPGTGLIRGRNSDGSWRKPFDQQVSIWAQGSDRDCENYYRNITFFAPHDVDGLIGFFGGKEGLESSLDYFFDNDFYYVGDEFSMHSPYLYNFAGKPWKAQKTIRTLIRDNFKDDFGGLPGNEDCGQLSAWYIFGAIGFYPFCPGTTRYQIGSPSFDEVVINLPDGKTFKVVARDNSPENMYIQSATLDGKPFDRVWIDHSEIMAGGVLEFVMGPQPNTGWGCARDDKDGNII